MNRRGLQHGITETFHRRAGLPRLAGIFDQQQRQPGHGASPFADLLARIGVGAGDLDKPATAHLAAGIKAVERTGLLRLELHRAQPI